ncbi:MAG: flagellar hook-associated protein FlgL [Bryobacter sp.]
MPEFLNAADSRFLSSLDRIQGKFERAQRELATGKRVFSASDEPDSISALLTIRSQLSASEQSRLNLGRTKAEVDAAENGLRNAVSIFERARVLAAQAQSGFNSEPTFVALQQEASDLKQQLLNVANLAIEGRYIFAGNSDLTQPFDYDPNTNLVGPYAGSAATRQSLYPGGSPFPIAVSGGEIFDSQEPGENAFAALQELEDALVARDPELIRQSLATVETATRHIASNLSYYGSIQRRVDEATAAAESSVLNLTNQLVRLEEADATKSIIDLQQSQSQLEVSLRVKGSARRSTLFDFLG